MQAIETDTPPPVPPNRSEPPLVLDGRYQIEDRLGGGGASDVYQARDLRLGRLVAVKMFRSRAGAHSDRRCGDEARLLAALNHPGLVAVYDAGWHDDREYLVLQLVDGRTLGRRIAAGPLSPREVVRIGAVLSDVLHHVHARNIVHRDVKPSNVLCADDGTVFLADFGISHPAGAEETDCSGVVVGTAPYLAPEQVQGGPVGPPCDVYALGLVLLECLTGKREYPGGQLEAAMARLHREPVVPEHTPAPLGRLIRSMTALEPAARPTALQCRKMLAVHDPQLASLIDRPPVSMTTRAAARAAAVGAVPGSGPVAAMLSDQPVVDVSEVRRRDSADLPTAAVLLAAASDDEPAGVVDEGVTGQLHREPVDRGPLAELFGGPIGELDEAVEVAGEAEQPDAAPRRRGTTGAHRRRRGAGLGSTLWLTRGRATTPEARAS